MKKALLAITLALVGMTAIAQTAAPTLAGMYSQASSGYTRMELGTSSGFKTHGALKSGFTYGIAKVKGDWLYRGTSAAAQLTNRPAFILVSQIDVSTQAIALVRFDVKKDHRETQYCEAGAWSGVKEENKNTIPLTVTRQPNTNTLTIVPASDLPAGEYLLIADQGKGYDGYDFSVK
jgi:opacity protein-like surface antigen